MIADPELPSVGVTLKDATTTRWCVWAPKAQRVEIVLESGDGAESLEMVPIARGYHAYLLGPMEDGRRYSYRLDGGDPLPDPCSRWQPEGINAPSAVWFPEHFRWEEGAWTGIERSDLVFYELHVGTFTPEGTFDAVIPRIEALLDLGITAIEIMPVAQFAGTRSWGYDGVHPFAPQHSYGGPQRLQRLVEACHRRGMAIFLDVIYNHFGPEGNVFPQFGDYFTDKYKTAWGSALNFDGRGSDSVRAMVLQNARQWIRDFRFDGLRLDAADQIFDGSPRHILSELAEVVHEESARLGRKAHVFAETDLNDAPKFLSSRDAGGYGLDGHWNDDFHHAAHVTLTGETTGYYVDFTPGPAALAKAFAGIFVNDGCYSGFRDRRHGTSATGFSGDRFVAFTQNHDQVGNRLKADRYAAMLNPPSLRLAAGILLLSPRLPLIFMGEEYGEAHPFPFFCDFQDPDLIEAVRSGRRAEFACFGWDGELPDPFAQATRDSAVLCWAWEDPLGNGLRLLYRNLLRLRRELPGLRDFSRARTRLLEKDVLEVLRGDSGSELRMVFNLSERERTLGPSALSSQPVLRSESTEYGGRFPYNGSWIGRLLPHEFVILPSTSGKER